MRYTFLNNNNINTSKRIKRFFNLFIKSSEAIFEDPLIGPNLSPYMARDKIKLFCEELNTKSYILKAGLKILVRLYLFEDKSFFFIIKGLSFSLLLKLLLNIRYKEFNKTCKIISIFDAYDMIYIKNIFNFKFLSYENLIFKKQIVDNINSIKNLSISK